MMSTKGQNFFGTLGQGLLAGWLAGGENYQDALTQQQDRLRKAQQERWELENGENMAKIAREKDANGIIASFGAPGSVSGAAGIPPAATGAQAPQAVRLAVLASAARRLEVMTLRTTARRTRGRKARRHSGSWSVPELPASRPNKATR